MTASFTLTLDTHAPSVEFGEPTGATAGELLHLPYTADEPLDAAELRLLDGRHLELTIGDDELTILLPPDTPAGAAAVWVSDDVGNARTYSAAIALQGVPAPTPDPSSPPVPGFPARRERPRTRSTRRVRSTSRLQVQGTSSVRARGRYLAIGVATSRGRVAAATSGVRPTRVRSRGRVRFLSTSTDTYRLASSASVRRGDGPSAEAAVLDLI